VIARWIFFFLLLRTTYKVHVVLTEADTEVLLLHHENPLVEKVKVAIVSILTLKHITESQNSRGWKGPLWVI